jgi:hypothetical protein
MKRRRLFSLIPVLAMAAGAPLSAAQPDVVAINVLLEPDAALADRATALNVRVRATERRGFALDATHVPHVTVVQQYVRREDVGSVGAAIQKVLETTPAPMELEVVGVDASPWSGSTMASLRVGPAPALMRFQEAVVAALIPLAAPAGDAAAFVRDPPETSIDSATMDYVSGFVLKNTGEKYQPHVTVGLTTQALASTLKAEPFQRQKFAVAKVAVYQLGNSGTARRRLWP